MVNAFNRLKPAAKRNMSKTLKKIQYHLAGLNFAHDFRMGILDDIFEKSNGCIYLVRHLIGLQKLTIEWNWVKCVYFRCNEEIFQCRTEYNAILQNIKRTHTHIYIQWHAYDSIESTGHWGFILCTDKCTRTQNSHLCVFINKNELFDVHFISYWNWLTFAKSLLYNVVCVFVM